MTKTISWQIYKLLSLILVSVYTLLTSVIVIIFCILFMFTPDLREKYIWILGRGVARFALFLFGCRVRVSGFENIPFDEKLDQKGRFCLVSNHTSSFDIVALLAYGKVKLGFVAKKSLGRIPILNIYMLITHCVLIDRKSIHSNIQAINKSADNIKNSIPMLIFPEGTRSKSGGLLEFKPGAMKLALKSQSPIIPVAIKNLRYYYEDRRQVFIDKHTIPSIQYLPSVDTSLFSDTKSLASHVQSSIEKAISSK